MKIVLLAASLFVLTSLPLLHTNDSNARTGIGPIVVSAKNLTRTNRSIGMPGKTSDTTEQVWLLRTRRGAAIGWWVLTCRWASGSDRVCTTIVRMPRGDIVATGVSPTPFYGTYAVLGGTGIYEGVGGAAEFTTIGYRKVILNIRLI